MTAAAATRRAWRFKDAPLVHCSLSNAHPLKAESRQVHLRKGIVIITLIIIDVIILLVLITILIITIIIYFFYKCNILTSVLLKFTMRKTALSIVNFKIHVLQKNWNKCNASKKHDIESFIYTDRVYWNHNLNLQLMIKSKVANSVESIFGYYQNWNVASLSIMGSRIDCRMLYAYAPNYS